MDSGLEKISLEQLQPFLIIMGVISIKSFCELPFHDLDRKVVDSFYFLCFCLFEEAAHDVYFTQGFFILLILKIFSEIS